MCTVWIVAVFFAVMWGSLVGKGGNVDVFWCTVNMVQGDVEYVDRGYLFE